MPIIPTNYTRAAKAISDITVQSASLTNRVNSGIQRMTDIGIELEAMGAAFPAGWLDAIAFINAQAALFPADEAWQRLKEQKNKLVADYQAERVRVTVIEAAISGL